nr:AbrB/MazE/SpoVT family DNA-binding domain-containing protein [Burkholderiales bacterium]
DGYRITGSRVAISRDPVTGHIVLSPRPRTWEDLLALDHTTEVPDDFLGPEDRKYVERDHDPLAALDE